jgi:hypothetical protein
MSGDVKKERPRDQNVGKAVFIVSCDDSANVGDLVYISCPVGVLVVGYHPVLSVGRHGTALQQRPSSELLASCLRVHFSEVVGGFPYR